MFSSWLCAFDLTLLSSSRQDNKAGSEAARKFEAPASLFHNDNQPNDLHFVVVAL
jgi:hypothetical protein